MSESQRRVEIKKEKEEKVRRFSVRQWREQNKLNIALGRPTIKLEEHENEVVRED